VADASCAWNNANNNGNNNVVGVASLPIVSGQLETGMFPGQQYSIATLQGSAQKQVSGKPETTRQRDGNFVQGATSKPSCLRSPSEKGYFFQLTELANLYRLWFKVKLSRSIRLRFVRFNERLMDYLAKIQYQLRAGHFEFGPYQFFIIREKKMRSVANAPLKDRIVHWLLYEHLLQHWLRRFIHDTYGNLPGRGTHAAVRRVACWARKPCLQYALQLDISKYFCSVNHAYLKRVLLEREGDQNIRHLLISLVDSYQTGPEFDHLFAEDTPYRKTKEKGMPLGNLTSQLFANIYLNEFDHWVKEVLREKYYLRYVDDLIFLGETSAQLNAVKEKVLEKLDGIGLTVNPKKIAIRRIDRGIPFLGYVVWKHHVSAGARVRKRFSRCLRLSEGVNRKSSIDSYRGFFKHTGATR
jgi:retron-type reverse transcriptase